MRTAVLPFIFIFNTQLLMIGIDSVISFISVVTSSVIAILLFAAATQGYWLVKNRLWETVLMLIVAFMFFRPKNNLVTQKAQILKWELLLLTP